MAELLAQDLTALRFLFTEDVYNLPERKPAAARPTTNYTYLGENNRSFLIILNKIRGDSVDKALKIMAAKKLELRDLAIMDFSEHPEANFASLKDFFACGRICLFGVDPQSLQIPDIPINDAAEHNGVKIMNGPDIDVLMEDITMKKAYWNNFKTF